MAFLEGFHPLSTMPMENLDPVSVPFVSIWGNTTIYMYAISPRFLCRPTAFFFFARAVGRQRALHKENSGFASPTLDRYISMFCGYQILFSIRNPYINHYQSFFHSFITILPSESGVTLHYSTILP